ncbi:hypothetical protein PVIIG_04396 [Plasmodium vivax India VII]|uniref:Uncharacterized protein n=1 Tax=Plasmodium vivax India VII TaxID=1077284 RepID=A0A0J9SD63_PLAVI|nr:hypothetical protein PVIIG_04396 [Plasmodium vivax India VII]
MKHINYYTFKKNPHIEKFYDEFNHGCEPVHGVSQYCSEILEEVSTNSDVKELYYKIESIKTKNDFGTNEVLSSLNNYSTKGCTYLKYWLYDQIITYGFNETETEDLFNLWEKMLQNNFKLIIGQNLTCKFHILKLEDIKKIKLLFDYLLNDNFEKNEHDIYNM